MNQHPSPQNWYANAYLTPEACMDEPDAPVLHPLFSAGTISFALGILAALGMVDSFLWFVFAPFDEYLLEYIVFVTAVLSGVLGAFGVIFGVIGCVQKNRAKVFSVLGLTLSFLIVGIMLMINGLVLHA